MHHADARLQGVHGAAEVHFLPVDQNFSFIPACLLDDAHAEENIHEGGFARPVFAYQAENASFPQGEIDILQHPVGKVRLADAFHAKQWICCAHGTSLNKGCASAEEKNDERCGGCFRSVSKKRKKQYSIRCRKRQNSFPGVGAARKCA